MMYQKHRERERGPEKKTEREGDEEREREGTHLSWREAGPGGRGLWWLEGFCKIQGRCRREEAFGNFKGFACFDDEGVRLYPVTKTLKNLESHEGRPMTSRTL